MTTPDFLYQGARSWKGGVKTAGDTDWVYNAMYFATAHEASLYIEDLARRWTAVQAFHVAPSDQPVNYRWVGGKAEAVKS